MMPGRAHPSPPGSRFIDPRDALLDYAESADGYGSVLRAGSEENEPPGAHGACRGMVSSPARHSRRARRQQHPQDGPPAERRSIRNISDSRRNRQASAVEQAIADSPGPAALFPPSSSPGRQQYHAAAAAKASHAPMGDTSSSTLSSEGLRDADTDDIVASPRAAAKDTPQLQRVRPTADGAAVPLLPTPPLTASSVDPASTITRSQLIKSKYRLRHVLGSGAFGQAILTTNRETGEPVVVKRVKPFWKIEAERRGTVASPPPPDANISQVVMSQSLNEVRALAAVQHPYAVRFHEAWVEAEDSRLHIAMEYCPGGDLQKFCGRHKDVSEPAILRWIAQLLLATEHLHARRIIHRDIKLENVFLSQDYRTAKLGDFGLSKLLRGSDETALTQAGTPYYFSPEMAEGHTHDRKTDVWSLGVVAYYLLERDMPFKGRNLYALLGNVARGNASPFRAGLRYSRALQHLVTMMLTRDASLRPSATELLAAPVLQCVLPELRTEAAIFESQLEADRLAQQRLQQQQQLAAAAASAVSSSSLESAPRSIRAAVDAELGTAERLARAPRDAGLAVTPRDHANYGATKAAAIRQLAAAAAHVPGHQAGSPADLGPRSDQALEAAHAHLRRRDVDLSSAQEMWVALKRIRVAARAGRKDTKLSVNLRAAAHVSAPLVARLNHGCKVRVQQQLVVGGSDGSVWFHVRFPVEGFCIAQLDGQELFNPTAAPDGSGRDAIRLCAPTQEERAQCDDARRQTQSPSRRPPSPVATGGGGAARPMLDRARDAGRVSPARGGPVPSPARKPQPSPPRALHRSHQRGGGGASPARRGGLPQPLRRRLDYDGSDSESEVPSPSPQRRFHLLQQRPSDIRVGDTTNAKIVAARDRRAALLDARRSPLRSPRGSPMRPPSPLPY